MAANANLERVHRIDAPPHATAPERFTLPDDVCRATVAPDAPLRAAGRTVAMVRSTRSARSPSAGTDSHKDASVAKAPTPGAQLAMDRGLAVVCVART